MKNNFSSFLSFGCFLWNKLKFFCYLFSFNDIKWGIKWIEMFFLREEIFLGKSMINIWTWMMSEKFCLTFRWLKYVILVSTEESGLKLECSWWLNELWRKCLGGCCRFFFAKYCSNCTSSVNIDLFIVI